MSVKAVNITQTDSDDVKVIDFNISIDDVLQTKEDGEPRPFSIKLSLSDDVTSNVQDVLRSYVASITPPESTTDLDDIVLP